MGANSVKSVNRTKIINDLSIEAITSKKYLKEWYFDVLWILLLSREPDILRDQKELSKIKHSNHTGKTCLSSISTTFVPSWNALGSICDVSYWRISPWWVVCLGLRFVAPPAVKIKLAAARHAARRPAAFPCRASQFSSPPYCGKIFLHVSVSWKRKTGSCCTKLSGPTSMSPLSAANASIKRPQANCNPVKSGIGDTVWGWKI